MGLKIGIVGLANVGKSTLFNAILGRQQALTAPYPFATVEPNIGVAEVVDERLIKLRDCLFPIQKRISKTVEQYNGKTVASKSVTGKPAADITDLPAYRPTDYRPTVPPFHRSTGQPPLVPATVTFVDIAGLVKGAAEGQGLGNQFLGHIRDVDLILHVLRDFDAGISRAADSKNPEYDAEIVRTELELKDLEIMEREKKGKSLSLTLDPSTSLGMTLLSKKPVIYAVNVGEKKLADVISSEERSDESRDPASGASDLNRFAGPLDSARGDGALGRDDGGRVFYFCAKLEEEISKMPKNEQKEYLKIYGLKSSCLDRIIGECFRALGLISFFTAGPKEVRAWPARRDSPAPKAAGAIHSDFEKLFIRAEIIEWEKLAEAGSWQGAKERGFVRTEGKDYLINDGDVCNFLIGK